MLKNGLLTLLFAFIPGAGQMYQGYMKRGLSLMLMCCAICVLAVLFSPIAFFLLLVFMYSFFDTLNLRAQIALGNAPADDYLVHLDPKDGYAFARCWTATSWWAGPSSPLAR